MKKLYVSLLLLTAATSFGGCVDRYLTTEPQTIITDEVLWTDPKMVAG